MLIFLIHLELNQSQQISFVDLKFTICTSINDFKNQYFV